MIATNALTVPSSSPVSFTTTWSNHAASAISFSAKATAGFGIVIGGFILDYVIRFPRGEEPSRIAQETIVYLGVVDGLVMPLLGAIPIYLVAKYTLTRERHAEIRREIDARREGERASRATAE